MKVDSVALPCFFLLNTVASDLMEDFSTPDVIRDLLSIRSMDSIVFTFLSGQV